MDELKYSENRKTKVKEKEHDWYLTVTVVQLVMCIAVGIVIFLISHSGGENADKLKNDFNNLMSITINTSDVMDTFSGLKDRLLKKEESSEIQDEPSSETVESETTKSDSKKNEKGDKAEKDATTKPQTVEDESLETKAVMASGGNDESLYSAKKNTSFSPVATTCPIVRPVDGGWYSSYFGYRINPITNENSFHTGLDIAVAAGEKIRAAYSGTVKLVGEDDHSGKYILLSHSDGFETFYCHCSKIVADEGAKIKSGETIALVGSTGWSTGPHLHFEVRKNGERLDPLSLLENDG